MSIRATFSAVALLSAACSVAGGDEVSISEPPPYETFPPVSDALHAGCGTLDCHGRPARNLRIYGANGLRLDASHVPGGEATTDDEHWANYQAVVALEPESMARVFANEGEGASRLTIVRKARGAEAHEGEAPFPLGSAGDLCLTAWLSGAEDLVACAEAAGLEPEPQLE